MQCLNSVRLGVNKELYERVMVRIFDIIWSINLGYELEEEL